MSRNLVDTNGAMRVKCIGIVSYMAISRLQSLA
jgi:hypothetical protein